MHAIVPSPITSVIIPCYGQAHFLLSAVRSALGQSIPDVEVVIVDDGSPDDPLGRLGKLVEDPRVVIVQQENRGLPAARNAGILASHGRLLNFLDADDWLAPEFCERLAPILESDESLGFVYCDVRHVFENHDEARDAVGEYSVGASRRMTSGNILPALLLGGYFTPNTVLVPRRILDCVGLFDPELGGNADWDLWLRIAAAGYSARYIDDKLAYYRIHGLNMSRDRIHMDETRSRTLHKLLRASPDAVADGLEELRRTVEEASGATAWIRSLEEAKAWNEQQVKNWQAEADRLEALNRALEEAKAWHQQQTKNWQAEAERLEALNRALEEAKAWHEQQAKNWQEEADRRQAEAERLQADIECRRLEAKNLHTGIEGLQAQAELLTAQLRRVPAPLRWFLERYPLHAKRRRG